MGGSEEEDDGYPENVGQAFCGCQAWVLCGHLLGDSPGNETLREYYGKAVLINPFDVEEKLLVLHGGLVGSIQGARRYDSRRCFENGLLGSE